MLLRARSLLLVVVVVVVVVYCSQIWPGFSCEQCKLPKGLICGDQFYMVLCFCFSDVNKASDGVLKDKQR